MTVHCTSVQCPKPNSYCTVWLCVIWRWRWRRCTTSNVLRRSLLQICWFYFIRRYGPFRYLRSIRSLIKILNFRVYHKFDAHKTPTPCHHAEKPQWTLSVFSPNILDKPTLSTAPNIHLKHIFFRIQREYIGLGFTTAVRCPTCSHKSTNFTQFYAKNM